MSHQSLGTFLGQSFYSCLILMSLLTVAFAEEQAHQLMHDPSFEKITAGPLVSTGVVRDKCEIQRTGRKTIQKQLVVKCVEGGGKSGKKGLSLSIPQHTQGFEFVTVGQRHQLRLGKEYEASVWVRWRNGPTKAPMNASPGLKTPSAIVSFWVRHQDGKGHFAGRDQWLFDNEWRRLTIRFHPTDSKGPSLIYVSLLPNQKPAATTILIDDFRLTVRPVKANIERRKGELVVDATFQKQRTKLSPPWYFANIGGNKIAGDVVQSGQQYYFDIRMKQNSTNFESGQLWQHLHLVRGVTYKINCRIRWNNYSPKSKDAIINYGMYHEASNTWYGPVDQILMKNDNWNEYPFTHIPPFDGKWKLYLQVNGWGNFGKSINISIDKLSCRPEHKRTK